MSLTRGPGMAEVEENSKGRRGEVPRGPDGLASPGGLDLFGQKKKKRKRPFSLKKKKTTEKKK